MIVQLDYLRNQTTNDLQRQTSYVTSERQNLQALAFAISRGELLGNSLANRPVVVNPSPVVSMPQQQSFVLCSSGLFRSACPQASLGRLASWVRPRCRHVNIWRKAVRRQQRLPEQLPRCECRRRAVRRSFAGANPLHNQPTCRQYEQQSRKLSATLLEKRRRMLNSPLSLCRRPAVIRLISRPRRPPQNAMPMRCAARWCSWALRPRASPWPTPRWIRLRPRKSTFTFANYQRILSRCHLRRGIQIYRHAHADIMFQIPASPEWRLPFWR